MSVFLKYLTNINNETFLTLSVVFSEVGYNATIPQNG